MCSDSLRYIVSLNKTKWTVSNYVYYVYVYVEQMFVLIFL